MVRVFVLKVDEFMPLVNTAREMPQCRVTDSSEDYFLIEADAEIVFNRKDMKMKPAVWYGVFTGGLDGQIAEFGRDTVRVIGTNEGL